MADGITTKILIEIRDELRGTNGRLDKSNERLDRLEGAVDRLGAKVEDTNEKLSVLAHITRGIDTRLSRIEAEMVFMNRRV